MKLVFQRLFRPKSATFEGIVLSDVCSWFAKESESGRICEQVLDVGIELKLSDLLLSPRLFLRANDVKQRCSSSPHMEDTRNRVCEFSVRNGAAGERLCHLIRMSECSGTGGHSCTNCVIISGTLKAGERPTRYRQALDDSSQVMIGGPVIRHALSSLCLLSLKLQKLHLISMIFRNHCSSVFALLAELGLRKAVLPPRNPDGNHDGTETAQAGHPLPQATDRPLRPCRRVNNRSRPDHCHSHKAGYPGINRPQVRPQLSQPPIGTARLI